jgi:Rad3-related DNA helicase/serine/threonine protein kinase
MDETTPHAIGSYTIIRQLGDEARNRTYLGKHPMSNKGYVTIRVYDIPLETNELRDAFLSRARMLKKLKHRQVAEIIDFGLLPGGNQEQQPERGYLVMQYTQGTSMRAREQRLKSDEVKRILSPVADALQYAHSLRIAHGNLHPGSILVEEGGQILLAGFAPLPPEYLPEEAIEPAALPYMAPEQLAGQPGLASDQYALAVMVYEWLCGRRPYEGTSRETLLRQQHSEPLPAPSSINAYISPAIEQVLLRALSPQPENRFPHTHTFAHEYLRALMGFTTPTQPASKQSEQLAPSTAPLHRIEVRKEEQVRAATPTPSEAPTTSEKDSDNAPDEYPRSWHARRTHDRRAPKEDSEHLAKVVTQDLSRGGVLSRSLSGYEERPAQLEMAVEVANALTKGHHALVEASTGTGKSLAYLLPIIRAGEGAIISTANKALQEQLFFKDIPFVQKHVKQFDAALVKGVGNYICLDRLHTERQESMESLMPGNILSRLWDITQEFELTISGDFETIGVSVPPELRSRVNMDRDECVWSKCEFFDQCYIRNMKEQAEKAQIIVVNHTLLLLDANAGGFILPQRKVTVVDEAHHLEEEATSAFTISVNQAQVRALLALTRLRANCAPHIQDETSRQVQRAWDELERVANPGMKGRVKLRQPIEEGLKLASALEKVKKSLEEQRPQKREGARGEKEEILYDRLLERTGNLASNIRHVFSVKQPEKYIYYVEIIAQHSRQRNSPLQVSAAPLDVSQLLAKNLFSRSHVIATSATLTTVDTNPADPEASGPTFAYFRKRTGLDRENFPDVQERILPLAFDYEHNALLYLPRHLPVPAYGDSDASISYMKAITEEMMQLVVASRGRAFLLFSSKRMMDDVLREFGRLPSDANLRLLRQGDMSRIELVKTFRTSEGAVLFGLKSFWEGVDIAGEALSLVVIDKLPFDPPDDPVHEARVQIMKERGEDWFNTYVLPQAVLRLKQGLGRLLRTHEDRGVMAILDTRLHRKGYGRRVLDALPPARRTHDFKEVERFFEEGEAPF